MRKRRDVARPFGVVTTKLHASRVHPWCVRARPAAVSISFLVLAVLHAWWGARMLLASNTLMGGSQLVSAGAFLLAAVSVRARMTFATALVVACAATAVRLLGLLPPGPFFLATLALAGGLGLAAWGLRRLEGSPAGWEPLVVRGGFALVALAYLAFVGAGIAAGNAPGVGSLDLVARATAGVAAALFVDVPPWRSPRRNAFAGEPASAAR